MKSSSSLRLSLLAAAAIAALASPARAATYDWNSGGFVQGVTAPDPLASGDVLNIGGGGTKFINGATLNVQGTVNWYTADSIYLQNGASVNNAGLWLSFTSNTLAYNGGSLPTFNNSGTFAKLGDAGATTVGGIAFVNSGVIQAETGNILFNGGNTTFNAGSSFIGAAGQTVINSNASFNGAFSSSNLVLAAGTFTGTAAALSGATPGSVAFTGGVLAGGWQIGSNQTLAAGGGGTKVLSAMSLDNQGTIAWNTTDNAYLQNGTVLNNTGSFKVSQDTTLVNNGGTLPVFNNIGNLNVAAGKTLNVGSVAFVNHSGGVIASDGVVNFNGGNAVFQDNTHFTGSGPININNNASFAGAQHGSTVAVNAGVASGNAAVVDGSLTFSGGTLTGGWTVSEDSQLVVVGGGNKFLDGVVLRNQGTTNWNSTDNAYLQNGTVLNNTATFNVNQSTTLVNNGGALPTFNNYGSLNIAAGKTLNVGSIAFVNYSAGVIASDGVVNFNSGNASFQANTRFTGSGPVNINTNANFAGTQRGSTVAVNAGIASGNAAVVDGSLAFSGGVFTGGWKVSAGSQFVAVGGGNKFMDGLVLDNQGQMNWNTTDNAYLQNGTVLNNTGVFNVNQSTALVNNGGSLPAFNNSGTLAVAAGQTLTVGSLAFVNQGGGVINTQGTVNFNGGNALFQGNTVFAGAGAVNINNNATFAGSYSGANVNLNAGTATGNGAVVGGSTGFSGGNMTGTWSVAGGGAGTLVLASGGNKFASGLQLANAGTLAVQTTDSLYVQNGSQITNTGTIDFRADGGWYNNGGAVSSIVNQGLIQKSSGSGTSTIGNGLTLSNLGTIDVRTGTLALPANFANDGTLKGLGAYSVAGTLSNAGHLAPGSAGTALGQLTLNGNYAQSALGSFDVGLNGDAFGNLLVNGAVSLDGTINVVCLGSCSYAVGTTWEVMQASGGVSGTFGSLLTTGFGAGSFAVDYSKPNQVWLTVTSATVTAVPEPSSTAMLFAGLAVFGFLMRRRFS